MGISSGGFSAARIAELYGRSESTVRKVLEDFDEECGIDPLPRMPYERKSAGGRPSGSRAGISTKCTQSQRQEAVRLGLKDPTLTYAMIRSTLDLPVTDSTVAHWFKQEGVPVNSALCSQRSRLRVRA